MSESNLNNLGLPSELIEEAKKFLKKSVPTTKTKIDLHPKTDDSQTIKSTTTENICLSPEEIARLESL